MYSPRCCPPLKRPYICRPGGLYIMPFILLPFCPGQLPGLVCFYCLGRICGRLPAVPDLRQAFLNYARASRICGLLCPAGSRKLAGFYSLASFPGSACSYSPGRIRGRLPAFPDPGRLPRLFFFCCRAGSAAGPCFPAIICL